MTLKVLLLSPKRLSSKTNTACHCSLFFKANTTANALKKISSNQPRLHYMVAYAFLFFCNSTPFYCKVSWANLSAVAAAHTIKTTPIRLCRYCHGFANPSLPRSPSAVLLFFTVGGFAFL